tara:strand:- start:401 stop:658 length:258 start_codon:yes stop_codon:yes gene_type:complete
MKNVLTPLMTQTIIKRAMHDRKLPFIGDNNVKTTSIKNNIIGTKSEVKEDSIKTVLKNSNIWEYWKVGNKNKEENDLLHLLPRNK